MYAWSLRKTWNLVIAPLRFPSLASGVLAAVCSILPIIQIAIFKKHDDYMQYLLSAHNAIEQAVPPNSLVIANGTLSKLFGILTPQAKTFRWAELDVQGRLVDNSTLIRREHRPWYVASLRKPGT